MNAAPARPEKQNDHQRGGHSCSSTGSASFGLRPHVGSGTRCGLVGVGGVFFGRPPFLPFSRTALALASEVARPPRRPSACAALFICGLDGCDPDIDVVARPAASGENPSENLVNLVFIAIDGENISRLKVLAEAASLSAFIAVDRLDVATALFVHFDVVQFFHFGLLGLVFVSGISPSICRKNTKPLRLCNRKVEKSSEREIPSGRRGCGAGERARQRHEGKTLNSVLNQPSSD